jgi:hypothetical protein
MMEVYHYILGFAIFLFAAALAESDKPTGLSQGSLLVPQNNSFILASPIADKNTVYSHGNFHICQEQLTH